MRLNPVRSIILGFVVFVLVFLFFIILGREKTTILLFLSFFLGGFIAMYFVREKKSQYLFYEGILIFIFSIIMYPTIMPRLSVFGFIYLFLFILIFTGIGGFIGNKIAEKIVNGAKDIKDARRILIQEERAKIAREGELIEPDNRWAIYQGDIATWQAPRQYDFIITDPPYPKEYLPLWKVLARRTLEWLKPGGLLIAMSGHSYLDQIYAILNEYLKYYWTAAYLTPGQPTPLRQINVNTTWKPLLIYSIGEYKGNIW